MQFRLTYEGVLLGSSRYDTRARHKHDIRKVFHPQLRRLWNILPNLAPTMDSILPDAPFVVDAASDGSPYNRVELLASRFSCGDYRLVPLVTNELKIVCGIHVLFLRPDPPGKVLESGDLDNRIKTLFDALRIPGPDKNELGGHTPTSDENPFFCLLEDDKLIDKVSVETDQLLKPTNPGYPDEANDSRVVITVSIRPAVILLENLRFV